MQEQYYLTSAEADVEIARIRDLYRREGLLHMDPFTTDLFTATQKQDVEWTRPGEVNPEFKLVAKSGFNASNIVQGRLGDCYVVVALSILTNAPDALKKVSMCANRW